MNELLQFGEVNWLAILVAAAAAFVIGAAWYSPKMFAAQWMTDVGLKKKDIEKADDMTMTMVSSFVLTFVKALLVALLVGALGLQGFADGFIFGGLLAVMFGATIVGLHYLYQMRTLRLFMIDAGYTGVQFIVISIILSIWQ